MRVVAILATYNEERFIASCLENLFRQGIHAYLVDNDSTDETVAIARRHLGRGLLGVENFPRDGVYRWSSVFRRKEQLAAALEPTGSCTLMPTKFIRRRDPEPPLPTSSRKSRGRAITL